MTFSFNLVSEPWIPCTHKNGQRLELGLRDVILMAHELSEVNGTSPITTASLHRLLLAILHRIFGPPNRPSWGKLWQAGSWDKERVNGYFERWMSRFDLFDPQYPIFQDQDNQRKPKSVASLIQGVAAGADATLFNHRTEQSDFVLTPAEAAQALITTQAFGLAGTAGAGLAFSDAACCRMVIFLMEGDNLFETLMLNLVRYPLESNRFQHLPQDCPSWEMDDPNKMDPERPWGYLDYLTWHNRSVRLIPEVHKDQLVVRSMQYGPGLRLPSSLFNPLAHFFALEKEGFRPLRFNDQRSLWRDSYALLEKGGGSGKPPVQIEWLGRLVEDEYLFPHQKYRLMALGMATEPGKDKVYFMRQERLPLPVDYLVNPELVEQLKDFAIPYAEQASKSLYRALMVTAGTYLDPEKDPNDKKKQSPKEAGSLVEHWGVERHYWAELGVPFYELVENLPVGGSQAVEKWQQTVKRAAQTAFQSAETALGDNPRSWKAVVRGRSELNFGLSRLSTPKKEA